MVRGGSAGLETISDVTTMISPQQSFVVGTALLGRLYSHWKLRVEFEQGGNHKNLVQMC
jgi:hypothetical protein